MSVVSCARKALEEVVTGPTTSPTSGMALPVLNAPTLAVLDRPADSRKALRDYLNRFPSGRFVNVAQDALDPLE